MLSYQQARSKPGIIFLLWAVLLFLTACGSIGEPPEPVTIRFTYPSNIMHFYEDYVTEFQEQNPDIIVELDPISPSALSQAETDESDPLSASQQSTWNPAKTDVFRTTEFDLPTFHDQNAILSLDPFISKDSTFDVEDFYPGTLDLFTFNGETWALPVGMDLLVMYYNKGLFDEAGLPYPQPGWTWDEFLDAAEAITKPDDVPTPAYGYSTIDGYIDTMVFIGVHGSSIFDDIQNPTRMTLNDPLTVEAMEFYADLFHTYQVAPTRSMASEYYASYYPLYEGARRGRTGMWILPFSLRGGNSEIGKWRFDWGIAPIPQGKISYAPYDIEYIYVMSAATENPDESWAWLSYLSQQMPQRTIPARRSLVESTDFETQMGADITHVVRSTLPYAALAPYQNWGDFMDEFGYFFQAVESIMDGTATPQEALDWAQEQAMK